MFEPKKKPKVLYPKKDKKKLTKIQSHDGPIDQNAENDTNQEGGMPNNSSRKSKEKYSIDRDEDKDQVVELKQDTTNSQNLHKKRRRKNVESKDAWT